MSEISRPWQGRTSEGALGDAGAYSAVQWAETWKTGFLTGGEKANRGVVKGVANDLAVTENSPASSTVLVSSGAGFVQGRWYYNDASVSLSIDANASGSTRIDVIVLQADYTNQRVRLTVVKGTPGAGYPPLTQSLLTIWQIPLAYLTLASGFASITNSMITDMREYANIPGNLGIDITNSSGATLEHGTLAIWLAGGGQAINTTTSEGSANLAGIVERRIESGGVGRIITQGVFAVLCDELVAVGDNLEASTTSGQAQKSIVGGLSFARVLVANTGAGTRALCAINVPIAQLVPACEVTHSSNQTVNNGATVVLAFNTELYDNASMHDTVTNNSRITFRRAGLYYIYTNLTLSLTAGGITVIIRLNGATTLMTLFAGNFPTPSGSRGHYFAANDYIEVVITNASGSSLTVNAVSAQSAIFGAHLVTP